MADLLTAAAAVVFAVAGLIVAIRSRHLQAEVRGVKLTMETQLVAPLDEIKVCTAQINKAVNQVGPGEPTMVQRLTDVESSVGNVKAEISAVGRKFDRYAADDTAWRNRLVGLIGLDIRAANAEQTNKENQ